MRSSIHRPRLTAARWIPAVAAALAVLAAPVRLIGGDIPPSAAAHGRDIYARGESHAGGKITAMMGEAGVEVPAAVLPCANCHGGDGRGRPEGGVVPTDITWDALTKPYVVHGPGGRDHPPYDERSITRAIAMGIDPAGNPLHAAMPRYRMTREQMEDLIAYLKEIGTDLDPGLSPGQIRIGTLLPGEGPFAARGKAMEAVLRAYFEDLNEKGGLYNRKIDLRVGDTAVTPDAILPAARRFLEEEKPFALAGVLMIGSNGDLVRLAEEAGIPLVGALSVDPQQDPLMNRHVFYLDAGLEGQARTLVEFAAQKHDGKLPRLSIVHRQGAPLDGVLASLEEQARARGWISIEKVALSAATFDPAALVKRLREGGTEVLLLLSSGPPEGDLLNEAARTGWHPQVLLPGSLASAELLDVAESDALEIFLAFPTLPSDREPAGLLEYRGLAGKYGLSSEFPAAQLAALVSAKILVEGLKRAGSELSRERLIAALEDLREFGTDLTPLVSYGPNRRVGISGAHIVSIDPASRSLVPVGGWIEPD